MALEFAAGTPTAAVSVTDTSAPGDNPTRTKGAHIRSPHDSSAESVSPLRPCLRRWRSFAGRRGFSLAELFLVTIIIGLLASIVAPLFQSARERAYVAQMQSDIRQLMDGVSVYEALNHGRWPASLDEVEEGGGWTPTRDVEYCSFSSVPEAPDREPYVIALAGHPGTTQKAFIVYPLWGTRILIFDSGTRGC